MTSSAAGGACRRAARYGPTRSRRSPASGSAPGAIGASSAAGTIQSSDHSPRPAGSAPGVRAWPGAGSAAFQQSKQSAPMKCSTTARAAAGQSADRSCKGFLGAAEATVDATSVTPERGHGKKPAARAAGF